MSAYSPAAVTCGGDQWRLCLRLLVCALVCFSTRYFKNRCSWYHQTWHRRGPPWILETY